jgi:hypothetical protein
MNDLQESIDKLERLFPEHVAKVVPERGASFTEYAIQGPLRSVLNAIDLIFAQYDPHGYGTRVRSIDMENSGAYTAKVWRANSCD